MLDEITRAVLSRDEIAKYLEGASGESGREARERIEEYVDELRTTQRYSMYRALKHPVYLLLRTVERIGEHVELAKAATRAGASFTRPITAAIWTTSSSRSCSTTTASGRRSSPPASTSSAARSGCSTATSPEPSQSAAIHGTRCT